MNEKTESKDAPDVRRLRDNELDAIAGGVPGLTTMVSSAAGYSISGAIDTTTQASGTPAPSPVWMFGW